MKTKRVTFLIPEGLWKKLQLIMEEDEYSTITHLLLEAIREFIGQKGH